MNIKNIFIILINCLVFISITAPSCPKKSPEFYFQLGQTKVKEGYNLEAIKCFSKAIKDKPDYIECYTERASVWIKEDSFDRAIEDYSKIIELNPSGEAYAKRGLAYWQSASGKDSLACKDFLKGRDVYNYNRCWDYLRLYCKK